MMDYALWWGKQRMAEVCAFCVCVPVSVDDNNSTSF